MRFFLEFLMIFCCFLFFCQNSFASSKRPIVDKIWFELSKKDQELLRKISIYLNSQKYDLALKEVEFLHKNYQIKEDEENPFFLEKSDFKSALRNLILWKKYSDFTENNKSDKKFNDEVSFNDISRFIEDNKFYPNIDKLRRRAENIASINKIPYRLSEQYFLSNPALDLASKVYLIESKSEFLLQFQGSEEEKNKVADQIQKAIIEVFVNENFDEIQEQEFLQKYSNYLTILDYRARISRLISDEKFEDAKRIFPFVEEDYQKLYAATIEIRLLPKYINNLIISVPRKLRKDENLLYARILWHKSRNESDDAVDLLLEVKEMQYPQKWWSLRRLYSRELLKTKDYKKSYNIIANHGLKGGQDHFWECEWMAGWIALRFLKKSEISYQHFEKLYENVEQPVSLSRASYWLGMASVAMKDKQKAIKWYKIASNYPLYFYGQLAIHKLRILDPLNASGEIILPKDPDITIGDGRKISASIGAKVAYLLALMGDKFNATKVFDYEISNAQNEGEVAILMRIVNEINDPEMVFKISRSAEKKNVFFVSEKFKIVKEVEDNEYGALVHSIIKQESGFMPSAVSVVGAIGFMQIMPETAKNIARDLGIPYNKRKLATDISYNVKLGSHYIKQMVEKFDGSQMIAVAAYNAGPHNATRWINEFYDPRNEEDIDKVVDWIELITYSETRNYVQRIMENLIVYKYLMKKS